MSMLPWLIGAGAVALVYKALSSKDEKPSSVPLSPTTGKPIDLPPGISFGPDMLIHFDQGTADRIKSDLSFFHVGVIDKVGPKVWRVPLIWAGGKMLDMTDPTSAAVVVPSLNLASDHPALAVMGPWRMATPVPLYDTTGLLLLAVPDKETAASYASPAGGFAIISMPKS